MEIYASSNHGLSAVEIQTLEEDDIDNVSGGVPWFAIPIAIGATWLVPEWYHHHWG
jgi:hypothetical protein